MATVHFLAVALLMVVHVTGHPTPCNQGNDTMCLGGVRLEFVRNDTAYWFGEKYALKCPNGPDGTFLCMNSDPASTNIAERLLGDPGKNFDPTTIEQFLHIRFNTPAGSYYSCGHRFDVEPFQSTKDIDNTHTIYYSMWTLDWRPTITFDYQQGQAYTLIAYDAGYQRIGGMWINIMSPDTATGEEVVPHWGPRGAMWQKRNPFVYALFRQHNGQRITTASSIRADVLTKSLEHEGHYFLEDLIINNNLEGPVGIGYIVVKADPFGILEMKQRNIFNNCPYLVSKNRDIMMALRIMGYELTDKNYYSDYRGGFLTHLEVDMTVRYLSKEAHFDSCCKHAMYKEKELTVDPFSEQPIMPIYTRAKPEVSFSPMEMRNSLYFKGKLFTLLLLDVTEVAVNQTDADTVVHWHVANFMAYKMWKGDEIRTYLPPIPKTNETRQFLFLLLKQKSYMDPDALWPHTGSECPPHLYQRCHFDFGTFQRSLNLEIVGLSHFTSKQDAFARAVLYGAVRANDVAESMSSFMSRPMGAREDHAMMTMAQVCDGVEGYTDPCPAHDHSDHSGQNQDDHSGH